MSAPLPGDNRLARRKLRNFEHAMRGAARWAVAPAADPERVRSAWAAWGLA